MLSCQLSCSKKYVTFFDTWQIISQSQLWVIYRRDVKQPLELLYMAHWTTCRTLKVGGMWQQQSIWWWPCDIFPFLPVLELERQGTHSGSNSSSNPGHMPGAGAGPVCSVTTCSTAFLNYGLDPAHNEVCNPDPAQNTRWVWHPWLPRIAACKSKTWVLLRCFNL